jgi:pantoate--beta-alanine ligase
MIIAKTISQIRSEIKNLAHKKVALVPTMGALHDGHLALVKKAKELADIVVVSIFVNKAQFNNLEDYANYPRQDLEDLKKLEDAGADLVFLPNEKEMFDDISFKIFTTKLTDCLCGSARVGHFEGVALIVTKLFNITKPDIAIFGQKDFQQLAIIKKLVSDLNFDIEIFSHETCRQESGLAMSSRNQRLSEDDKIKASSIFKTMLEIKNEILEKPHNVTEILLEKSKKLLDIGFEKIDYLEIREEDDLKLVLEFNHLKASRIFFAGYLGGVRLIDNLKVC